MIVLQVHLLIDCEVLSVSRQKCGVGRFITINKQVNPNLSSVELYAMFLNDGDMASLRGRVLDLYFMYNERERILAGIEHPV